MEYYSAISSLDEKYSSPEIYLDLNSIYYSSNSSFSSNFLSRFFSFRISFAYLIRSSFSFLRSFLSFFTKSPFYCLAVSEITGVISTTPVSGLTLGYFLYLSGGAEGEIDIYSRCSSFGGVPPNTDPVITIKKNPTKMIPRNEVSPAGI